MPVVTLTNVVAHSLQNGGAEALAVIVWRSKVGGNEAQNISECHLEIQHLVD
jgi:hypothetical protein